MTRRPGVQANRGLIIVALALLVVGDRTLPVSSQTGVLQSVSPLGASAGIPIYIIGTGFNTTATNNRVTFTPAQGEAVTVAATAILTVDATRDRRRLTVYVPAGLPAGTTALSVTNTVTGGVSSGVALEHLILSPPVPMSSRRNVTGLLVSVQASANTNFISGRTTVNLGTGITTRSVAVLSPTQVVATVDIAATASFGPRTLLAQTTNQSLRLANAFTVVDAPPNRPPVANANGPYAGEAGAAVSFSSAGSSDPDGDSLTFAWSFGDGGTSTDPNPMHTYASPGTFAVSLTVNDGKGGTSTATTTAQITQANRPPSITSKPSLTATVGVPYAYQVTANDPDGDSLTFSLPIAPGGLAMNASGAMTWTPLASQQGPQAVAVQVSDGRGGVDTQTFTIDVSAPAAATTGISVAPDSVRFSEIDASRNLAVTGTKSDGSTTDLTSAAAGTFYASSNPFVVSVSADGVITARGNGETQVTATNGAFSDAVAVVVESGVTLQALLLTPASVTLRRSGATQVLSLQGTFSDGSTRDLTSAAATTYATDAPSVATVAAGTAVAVANGRAVITARHGDLQATAEIVVEIPDGAGFVHGTVFDDSTGLPLPGATVTLLSDGGGSVEPAIESVADERGRYALSAHAGAALVRIRKTGFTTVDRVVTVSSATTARALDARLTPTDARPNPLLSAFGGQARNTSNTAVLTVAPGVLQADADLRITLIGSQGAAGRLPFGWSPISGAEVGPETVTLAQPALLVLPNAGDAPAGSSVTFARYDRALRRWTVLAPAMVSTDGRTIVAPIDSAGAYVMLVPDVAPHVPPAAVTGQALEGVAVVPMPDGVTADGEVTPRAAPPGESVRAIGRVGLQSPSPLPSGSVLQVHVTETFELLDASTIAPLPFTQDILVHARPRPPDGGALGTSFPITPSRNYSVQELMRGIVKLNVSRPGDQGVFTPVGPQGAVVTTVEGDALTIPVGALAAETVVQLRRTPNPEPTTAGLELLVGLDVDLVGASLSSAAGLSVPLPAGLGPADQVLLVQSFLDPTGVRRLRVAALGRQDSGRLIAETTVGALTLPGVTTAGRYYFMKAAVPVGFVTGTIGIASGTPASSVLVTSTNVPLVDVSDVSGRYTVAALPDVDATIAARHLLTADATTGLARPSAREAVVVLPLTLNVAPPSVVAVSPGNGAVNVPLDTSITIDFSEPLDPTSITNASVSLKAGIATVSVTLTLSQDRRRLTLRPAAPLAGKTPHTLILTSDVRDLSGLPLQAFAPVMFTTLDPTKPPQLPPGQIVAALPDEGGFVTVTGQGGSAEASTPVTATNLRTQETITVLAGADGSFVIRLSASVGDDITLTFRDSAGRETTVRVTQLEGEGGTRSIGTSGGTFTDAQGRSGSVLPRALINAGTFRFLPAVQTPAVSLTSPFSYVDRFKLQVEDAEFNRMASLTLSEDQGRFAPASILGAPFEANGELTVPADFLINSALRFSATAQDAGGLRRNVSAATVVVASGPDAIVRESAHSADFPTVFIAAPTQARPTQVVTVRAEAPDARIDLDIPALGGTTSAALLARLVDVDGVQKLSIVDAMLSVDGMTGKTLRTSGRTLPGMKRSGEYAIVTSSEPLVFVTGQLIGAAGTVAVAESPFVFETTAPNGRFAVPIRAGQPFTLHLLNADGSLRGTASGQAPAEGTHDIGDPLGAPAGQLAVTAEPGPDNVVDIGQPILLRFSEPIDVGTLPAGVLVSDANGSRVYGRFSSADDGRTIEFRPSRRWRYASTYRYTVTLAVLARTGARLTTAVTRQFSTFAPSPLASTDTGTTVDVATSGSISVIATSTGVSIVDVASPVLPRVRASLPMAGGGRAVALLPPATFVDRNGLAIAGPVAVTVSGGPETGSRLDLFDLSTLSSPVLLGTVHLTAAPGQAPPAGVLTEPGTPREVLVAGNRAFVAIEHLGLVAVDISQAVPSNPSNSGAFLLGRYPSTGVESVTGVALVRDRLVVVGAAGLTVLDAVTLARRGGLSTGDVLHGVKTLPSFSMDVNGDGAIIASETFDLAVATGGSDGTVQLFAIPALGDPTLLSVVRVGGETAGVVLSADERLAYVAAGVRGLFVMDLDGPASVQPIDLDRGGVDDRVLATIEAGGSAFRTALALPRGIGFVANGAAGLATVRLLPGRTRFVSLLRDPVRLVAGEEQDISKSHKAYLSDDGLKLTLDVVDAPGEPLVLSIEEAPGAGARLLQFDSGSSVAPLASGLNSLEILLNKQGAFAVTTADLTVRNGRGQLIARLNISFDHPDAGTATLTTLRMGPEDLVLPSSEATAPIGVAGFYDDGSIFNLTSAESGTRYATTLEAVATVDPSGRVTGHAGGTAGVTATNGLMVATLPVRVQAPRALVSLTAERSHVTVRSLGTEVPYPLVATFSDGSEERSPGNVPGLTFTSTDAAVVTVSADGVMRTIQPGVAKVLAVSGTVTAELTMAVEPRTPASISGIALLPITSPLSLDDAPLFAVALVSGSGALDGHLVSVSVTRSGAPEVSTIATDLGGGIAVRLDAGAFVGSAIVTVTVIDPATNTARSDSRTFTIAAGTSDGEPNGDLATASPLRLDREVDGTLDGVTDRQDTFAINTVFDGTLEIDLRLADGVPTANVTIIVRNAAGQEIARFVPSGSSGRVSVQVPAGAAFVTIESASAAVSYSLSTRLVQANVSVSAVTPMSGGPGTLVTIDGSGFSTRLDENQVFFSSIAAEVVSATSTRIQARVPANAVNGALEVISGDRAVTVEGFATGAAGPRPAAYVMPEDASATREDPVSGTLLDVSRLLVTAGPSITRVQMDELAAQLAGRIAGYIPLTNQYVLEFPQNRTLDGLNGLRQQLLAQPVVRAVVYSEYVPVEAPPSSVDTYDSGTMFTGTTNAWSGAHDLIRLREAVDLVRSTPPFTNRDDLKDVRVAVVDTGFDPGPNPNEFFLSTNPSVEFLTPSGLFSYTYAPTTTYRDVVGHGTLVTSIIAAGNDGSILSGVLNSLVDSSELPFPTYVYDAGTGTRSLNPAKVIAALDHIRARVGTPIQVINMSFGNYATTASAQCTGQYAAAIRAFRGRALIVASAGNDGVESRCHFPSAYATTEPHVMSIGAVAVAAVDGTVNEQADDRAIWENVAAPATPSKRFARCNTAVMKRSSNCLPGVTLAAPGEEVPALKPGGYQLTRGGTGTSSAAPMVASVAAMLQAIRPTEAPLPPGEIRALLTSTATEIEGQWDAGQPGATVPILRLNALAAVEALLPLRRAARVYVADQDAPSGTSEPGAIISLSVDSLTGTPSTQSADTVIVPLTVRKRGVTLTAGRPRTIVMSASDAKLYVYASSDQFGDGIVVVNTRNQLAIDFIPLSGARFPAQTGPQPAPFRTFQQRPPMVLSRDGRLLYVATNYRLTIVNTVNRRIVRKLEDLPAPFNAFASYFSGQLQARLTSFEQVVLGVGALFNRGGGDMSALEMSPDGKTLYAAIRTGSGTDAQPGFVFSLKVNLYRESLAPATVFNSPLIDYFSSGPAAGPALDQPPLGDEPADLAVAPTGDRLYVVNGGVSNFSPANLNDLTRFSYALDVHTQSSSGTGVIDPNLIRLTEQELAEGTIIVNAPGAIELFAAPALGTASRRFESSINFGWQPNAASGGLVLSPTRFGRVFAKRPMSLAIRPDGKRALVAFHQTGNFGVLDTETAERFANPDARVAATPGLFSGVVGVTPSIRLGKDLVPVDPADSRRLYANKVQYAQSGHFAVGLHSRAVSFINDSAIDEDLQTHGATSPLHGGVPRPYYTHFPVCAVPPAVWTEAGTCDVDVVTTLFEYAKPGGTQAFLSPRGLAIAPVIEIATPRFGDRIYRTKEIQVRWRDDAVAELKLFVFDLGPPGSTGVGPNQGGAADNVSGRKYLKWPFWDLFVPDPIVGHRYRILVTAHTSSGTKLSEASVDVTLIR